ncbi:hypothetical protein [Mycobacteroides abscessus]|nr:hypothetical protein [Mycobacteroides abscessus]
MSVAITVLGVLAILALYVPYERGCQRFAATHGAWAERADEKAGR